MQFHPNRGHNIGWVKASLSLVSPLMNPTRISCLIDIHARLSFLILVNFRDASGFMSGSSARSSERRMGRQTNVNKAVSFLTQSMLPCLRTESAFNLAIQLISVTIAKPGRDSIRLCALTAVTPVHRLSRGGRVYEAMGGDSLPPRFQDWDHIDPFWAQLLTNGV
jgi:hypothetical protein